MMRLWASGPLLTFGIGLSADSAFDTTFGSHIRGNLNTGISGAARAALNVGGFTTDHDQSSYAAAFIPPPTLKRVLRFWQVHDAPPPENDEKRGWYGFAVDMIKTDNPTEKIRDTVLEHTIDQSFESFGGKDYIHRMSQNVVGGAWKTLLNGDASSLSALTTVFTPKCLAEYAISMTPKSMRSNTNWTGFVRTMAETVTYALGTRAIAQNVIQTVADISQLAWFLGMSNHTADGKVRMNPMFMTACTNPKNLPVTGDRKAI